MRCPLVLVGVDVGGTFTDFVGADADGLRSHKVRSSRAHPGRVVINGLRAMGGAGMAHGTTVATNAVLEGRGARIAFVTTSGFEDLLAIGRQNRPSLYDLRVTRPQPLAPPERRFGVEERVAADGTILRRLEPTGLAALAAAVRASGAESVAVCLLFSFVHPEHERAVREALAGLPVSLSSEVLPEFREYERASTTALDAYVKPLAARYLRDLEASLGTSFLVMRSSGGVAESSAVRQRPIEMLLSGPAGGVAAAKVVADRLGERNLVTFDMGGTSADVSVIAEGEVGWTTEASVGGHPLAAPVVDITSVGAGGGSIVWFDAGGALRVGPQSAGGDPGPMCYGRGGSEFTVADADFLGGALPPSLLGGGMALDGHAATAGAKALIRRFGKYDDALLAVQSVVRATMASAIRLALSKRGLDPRDFALLAFGGAGPMHAPFLAQELGIRRVLVPFLPGAFSAYGILVSDVRLDFGRTRVTPLESAAPVIEALLAEFTDAAKRSFAHQGFSDAPILSPSIDIRYVGQSYEVNVPVGTGLTDAFHRRHEALYGYASRDEPIELVTVRLTATVARPRPIPPHLASGESVKGARQVLFPNGREVAPVYHRPALPVGFEGEGPAVIEEAHATSVVPPAARFHIIQDGILAMEVAP